MVRIQSEIYAKPMYYGWLITQLSIYGLVCYTTGITTQKKHIWLIYVWQIYIWKILHKEILKKITIKEVLPTDPFQYVNDYRSERK